MVSELTTTLLCNGTFCDYRYADGLNERIAHIGAVDNKLYVIPTDGNGFARIDIDALDCALGDNYDAYRYVKSGVNVSVRYYDKISIKVNNNVFIIDSDGYVTLPIVCFLPNLALAIRVAKFLLGNTILQGVNRQFEFKKTSTTCACASDLSIGILRNISERWKKGGMK